MQNLPQVLEGHTGTIKRAFHLMGVAEDVIQQEKTASPQAVDRIQKAFRYLAPDELLLDLSDELYRAHVREIVRRVGRGETDSRINFGTRAETT